MRLTLFIALLCAVLGLGAQTVDNNTVDNTAEAKHNVFLPVMAQEKVYLHFDNTGYFNGETIYFKAYVVNAITGQLANISKVLYVELLSPGGDIIATRKCAIVDGQANGEIKLEKVFGSGFYEVRAFTRYMTNWGASACFSRVFPIFNAPEKDGDYSQRVIDKVSHQKRLPDYRGELGIRNEEPLARRSQLGVNHSDDRSEHAAAKPIPNSQFLIPNSVNFFPEGGYSVKGLLSKVAFAMAGMPEGKDSIVEVRLVDAGGETVERNIVVDDDGRGVFAYVPDGSEMSLVLKSASGKEKSYVVPAAADEGVSLTVEAVKGDYVTASIGGSEMLRGKKFGIMLQNSGNIVATDTFTITETPKTLAFARKDLPAGVSVLTVFDGGGSVLADRMVFVIPEAEASDSIRVEAKTESLRPCGGVELELTALPNTTFSFSAMDAATLPNGKEGNAKTWLLLSSELRGYIPHPDYYFEADDAAHRRAADLLMMVQGWRKYSMPTLRPNQPIEDKLYLFGQLRQAKKKHGVAGVDLSVYLYNKAGQSLKGETRTDSVGKYRFELPDCNGEWNMLMYTKKEEKNVKYYVGIDRHFSPAPRVIAPEEQGMQPICAPNLFVSQSNVEDGEIFVPLNDRVKVLPTIKVKGRRVFDLARESWESEKTGERGAQLYYNCDLESDKYADSGLEVPGFYKWLQQRNPLFGGSDVDMENSVGNAFEKVGVDQIDDTVQQIYTVGANTLKEEMYEGLTYKNRPIVWILNNNYYMTTGTNSRKFEVTYMQRRSLSDEMPVFLDEVKSVYVRDNVSSLNRYIMSDQLQGFNPVMVFIYTHHSFMRNVKGLRRTHFLGYEEPAVFQMEDYSIMPPMEDFRRTIFWEPNVRTDAKGKATVKFYNNSSCRQMYISAEGITKDGRYLINN